MKDNNKILTLRLTGIAITVLVAILAIGLGSATITGIALGVLFGIIFVGGVLLFVAVATLIDKTTTLKVEIKALRAALKAITLANTQK